VVFLISRRKGAGRRWREWWPSKIDSNWSKHSCCCWFDQKWPSNLIKNDNKIFEHPQDCSSSDSERGFGKEKVVCMLCSTLLDTCAKGRSSHILPRNYCNGRYRQILFNRIITGDETLCFACYPETKWQSSEWVGETSPRPKKLKFQSYRIKNMLIIFFDSQGVVHKEFVHEGKTVNAEFYKGVMVRLLQRIQRVRPAVFCSREFSCSTKMRPPTKLQVFANFWPKNMLQPFMTPRTLRQNIFCSPSWKWS
jgi:hypothetical protein